MENTLKKIDLRLLGWVNASSVVPRPINCIVWVKDYQTARQELLSIFPPDCLVGDYPFIGAFGLSINQNEILKLAQFGWVDYVSTVMTASIMMDNSRKLISVNELHAQGYLGQGIGVAIIDTGCFPHLDLTLGHNRLKAFVDILEHKESPYDDNGHGTFVAGVLGGSGLVKGGRYRGIAPACDLVILKALNQNGETQAFNVLDAMQWVYDNHKKYNIKVVCMSFGSTPLPKNDPLIQGALGLWNAGLVVLCAGGNDGPKSGSIKSPGACSKLITVGSVSKNEKTGLLEIASFSSRGPIFNVIKPDIVAPGVDINSLSNSTEFYTQMSGTSVSTPFVAGVAALLLQREPRLTPDRVKSILLHSTIRLPYDINECGSGLVNAYRAFEF